jgi:hypothetical protein
MDTKKTNQAEITQGLIERAGSELANKLAVCNHLNATSLTGSQDIILLDLFFQLAVARRHEILVNPGLLYQGIEHVKDTVCTPYLDTFIIESLLSRKKVLLCSNLSPFCEHVQLFVRFAFDLASP